ncbi:MAG: tyrosine-type recombinase/integrase [Deltaproteobacteria bacterium]|nr:tyrosine-type recombinase/integrase [Deltaproteobacteria bacterium]
MDLFLHVARERQPQSYALTLVLFTTTLRLSAALALRWEDLDFDTMEIVVSRRLSEGVVTPGGEARQVRYGLASATARGARCAEGVEGDLQREAGEVGAALSGRRWSVPRFHARTCLRKPIKDILKHASITKRFTPHGCRRTGSSMAMHIAGHRALAMHEHYAPVDATESRLEGDAGRHRTGDRTGDAEPTVREEVCKSAKSL